MSISIEALKEAIQIKEQIAKLEARLSQLLGGAKPASSAAPAKPIGKKPSAAPAKARAAKGKRSLSPEARARISAAATARWAAKKKS